MQSRRRLAAPAGIAAFAALVAVALVPAPGAAQYTPADTPSGPWGGAIAGAVVVHRLSYDGPLTPGGEGEAHPGAAERTLVLNVASFSLRRLLAADWLSELALVVEAAYGDGTAAADTGALVWPIDGGGYPVRVEQASGYAGVEAAIRVVREVEVLVGAGASVARLVTEVGGAHAYGAGAPVAEWEERVTAFPVSVAVVLEPGAEGREPSPRRWGLAVEWRGGHGATRVHENDAGLFPAGRGAYGWQLGVRLSRWFGGR